MDPTALDMAMVQAPRGPVPMEEDVDIHEPFTSEERFRQLKDIDYVRRPHPLLGSPISTHSPLLT